MTGSMSSRLHDNCFTSSSVSSCHKISTLLSLIFLLIALLFIVAALSERCLLFLKPSFSDCFSIYLSFEIANKCMFYMTRIVSTVLLQTWYLSTKHGIYLATFLEISTVIM
jgi:hypothetical protein